MDPRVTGRLFVVGIADNNKQSPCKVNSSSMVEIRTFIYILAIFRLRLLTSKIRDTYTLWVGPALAHKSNYISHTVVFHCFAAFLETCSVQSIKLLSQSFDPLCIEIMTFLNILVFSASDQFIHFQKIRQLPG